MGRVVLVACLAAIVGEGCVTGCYLDPCSDPSAVTVECPCSSLGACAYVRSRGASGTTVSAVCRPRTSSGYDAPGIWTAVEACGPLPDGGTSCEGIGCACTQLGQCSAGADLACTRLATGTLEWTRYCNFGVCVGCTAAGACGEHLDCPCARMGDCSSDGRLTCGEGPGTGLYWYPNYAQPDSSCAAASLHDAAIPDASFDAADGDE